MNRASADDLAMSSHITVTLRKIPKYLRLEHHPDQVNLYSKFTELTFEALKLPSIALFMEDLASELGVKKLEIIVMRLPARRSKIEFLEKEGKTRIVQEELHGAAVRKRDLILVWPSLIWPNKTAKASWSVGIRSFILNDTIRAVIHEMLHKSGIKDEDEVRKLTNEHYKKFRRIHLRRFEMEFEPLLNEWKRTEKEMGLR